MSGLMVSEAEIAYRRSLLSKIVNILKNNFKEGQGPLTFDKLIKETREERIMDRIKSWLVHEGFPNHPKIRKTRDGRYAYKLPLKCRDEKSLLELLKRHYEEGLDGIAIDDIYESVQNAKSALEALFKASVVNSITRPDGKKILFYYPNLPIPEIKKKFADLFDAVGKDGFDAQKVGEYVERMEG